MAPHRKNTARNSDSKWESLLPLNIRKKILQNLNLTSVPKI